MKSKSVKPRGRSIDQLINASSSLDLGVHRSTSLVDKSFMERLSEAVALARGKRNQREFADLLGVAQSTAQSWEKGQNVPTLENLEKLATLMGQRPEEFLAQLYGRPLEATPLIDRIAAMTDLEVAELLAALAEWAKDRR